MKNLLILFVLSFLSFNLFSKEVLFFNHNLVFEIPESWSSGGDEIKAPFIKSDDDTAYIGFYFSKKKPYEVLKEELNTINVKEEKILNKSFSVSIIKKAKVNVYLGKYIEFKNRKIGDNLETQRLIAVDFDKDHTLVIRAVLRNKGVENKKLLLDTINTAKETFCCVIE